MPELTPNQLKAPIWEELEALYGPYGKKRQRPRGVKKSAA
jgi:hypothetical protein